LWHFPAGRGGAGPAAGSGPEAIEAYRQARSGIALVLPDLSMPGMSGVECFRRLRELDPQVRALISTGHGADHALQGLLDQGAQGVLRKPYVVAELAETVAATLAA